MESEGAPSRKDIGQIKNWNFFLQRKEPSKARLVKVTVGEMTVSDCSRLAAINSAFYYRREHFKVSSTTKMIKS